MMRPSVKKVAATAAPSTASSDPKPVSRISARLDPHKVSDPFATKTKFLTMFSKAYQAGAIPCRINHGGVKSHLQWDKPITEVDYGSLLPACAEGLRETEHPFVFVARTAFKDLLEAEGGGEKAIPLLSKITPSLRLALQSSAKGVFDAALDAIQQLSAAVGPAFNTHIHVFLVQISKKLFDKSVREKVQATIEELERNGAPDAYQVIKTKIPSYSSVLM